MSVEYRFPVAEREKFFLSYVTKNWFRLPYKISQQNLYGVSCGARKEALDKIKINTRRGKE